MSGTQAMCTKDETGTLLWPAPSAASCAVYGPSFAYQNAYHLLACEVENLLESA